MCALVKFKEKAIPVNIQGEIKYTPAIRLGSGDFMPISHQGDVILFDTKEEAEEYFND